MRDTPIAKEKVKQDDLGLVRISAIPLTVCASVLTASMGAYLFAIGMLCLGVGLTFCVLPNRAPSGRRLRIGLGLIYASAAFVLLQVVAFLLTYPST